ncbi:hypothetical protein TMatcc_010195 [Talaromyces marneffei ATCC 18224]
MKSSLPIVSAVLALMAVQLCPAPAIILGPIIVAAAAGAIGGWGAQMGTIKKRDYIDVDHDLLFDCSADPFASLPQPAGNLCKEQLTGANIRFSPNGEGAFRIDGVPSACMTLSNVIIGQDPNQPRPTPLGSSSLGYSGLSNAQLDRLQSVLESQQRS